MDIDKHMKVSIIIPIYNVEQFITACLQSVVNQTMTDGVECILVDDCGKDNSVSFAKDFIDNYNGNIKFSVIHHEQNGGLSAARNTGINAAKGDYVYFLDSDDKLTPNCLELMYSYVRKFGHVDLVQGSFYSNEDDSLKISHLTFHNYCTDKRQIKKFLLTFDGDIIKAQSRLVRREFLVSNNLYFKIGIIHEDNLWTYYLAKKVDSMAFCNIRTYYHRYNPGSITRNINIEKEIVAYTFLVENMSENIDPFLPGHQKELILNTLIIMLRNKYYDSVNTRKKIIKSFSNTNSFAEKILLKISVNNETGCVKKVFYHLLNRLYKFNDK